MKRTLGLLMLVLAIALPLQATTLTGSIKKPDGTTLTGRLRLTLSHPAHDTVGNTIITPTPVTFTITSGALPGTASVVGNDVLLPAHTYYWAEYFNSSGVKLMANAFYVSGASFDIGAAKPTTITTSNISYLDPGLSTNALRADLASTASTKGDELIGYKASGAGAVNRTVDERLKDLAISAADYGFASSGTGTANAAALNAIITLLSTAGGEIDIKKGVYDFATQISLVDKSNIVIRGQGREGLVTGASHLTQGTVLKWTGTTSVTFFNLEGAQYVTLELLGIDGYSVGGCIAVSISSDNDPISRRVTLREITIMNIGTGTTDGTGIQVGAGGSYQCDGVVIEHFTVALAFNGILINSDNAMDFGTIQNGMIYACNTHINVERGTHFTIRGVQMAKYIGDAPRSAVRVNAGGNMLIENCIMEPDEAVGADEGYGLYIVNGSYYWPITLNHCVIANIKMLHGAIVKSEGCTFARGSNTYPIIEFVGDSVVWTSVNDTFIDYSTDPVSFPEWETALVLNPGTGYSVHEMSERGDKWLGYGITDYASNHTIKVNGQTRGSVTDAVWTWGLGKLSSRIDVSSQDWKAAYTVTPASNYFDATGSSFTNGEMVQVIPGSGGVLAEPLVAYTDYYVINAAGTAFQLSATLGGAAIDITTAGTAPQYVYFSHPLVGSIQIFGRTGIYLGATSDNDVYLVRNSSQKWVLSSEGHLASVGGGYIGTRQATWAQIGGLTDIRDGAIIICSDCTIGSCGTSGSGAQANRINNAWVCK